jgi:hypothetical protein
VGWDEIDRDDENTGKLTPEALAREDRIDVALFPIIERYFLQEKQASPP